jgi:hypothetical protein
VQGQKNRIVDNCRGIGNRGHAFHPGTGVQGAEFTNCLGEKNGGDGLYYCWGNNKVNVRNCTFIENDGDGIGGLGWGAPADTWNTIENNTIERNGEYGIQCGGGGATNNVIRNNIIRDSSRSKPGAFAGIGMAAMRGGLRQTTVENNVIESTLEKPTQWVGIEEQHTIQTPRPVKGQKPEDMPSAEVVALVDENRIVNNKLKGHKTADIIVRGPKTVADSNTGTLIEERTALGPVKAK